MLEAGYKLAGPTPCKGCGQLILFEKQDDGKWLVSEWDETNGRKGERHNCPNYQPKQRQPQQWTSSNKQGQFTQFKASQPDLGQATQQTQNILTQKLNQLEEVKKLVHDQNILLHTIGEEIKALNNNVIAALVQLGDKQKQKTKDIPHGSERQADKQLAFVKSEEFGEQGENAASNLEEYDY